MNNKQALESLSMDLKRVALGYHRNSLQMAQRFYEEACKRKKEVDTTTVKPYLQTVLKKIEQLPTVPKDHIADEALLLSILIQNYTQTFL